MDDNKEPKATVEGYPEQIGEQSRKQTEYPMILMSKMSLVMVYNDELSAIDEGYPEQIGE